MARLGRLEMPRGDTASCQLRPGTTAVDAVLAILLVAFASANSEVGGPQGTSDPYPVHPVEPTAESVNMSDLPAWNEFMTYQDQVWEMARKTLLDMRSVDDQYMTQVHDFMCEKQRVLSGTGTNHDGVSVCARIPPGFDKDRDCAWYTNALGQKERNLMPGTCSDLLEEEYFYNVTFSHELTFKTMQQETLQEFASLNDAIKATYANHVAQAWNAGARTSLSADAEDLSGDRSTPLWQDRETEAWRAQLYEAANTFADKMREWIKQNALFRNTTLLKVATDVNRSLEEDGALIGFEELQKHTSAWDCWGVVNGGVYDFTPWIHSHPGGGSLIVSKCGTDITNSWNHFHASVGELPAERRMGTWNLNDAMYPTTTGAPCSQEHVSEDASPTNSLEQETVQEEEGEQELGQRGGEDQREEEEFAREPNAVGPRPALVRRVATMGAVKSLTAGES